MPRTDEISARLVITGFTCDPDHITHLLGVKPHEIWRIGDALPFASARRRADNGWVIASTIHNTIDLDAHVTSILHVLDKKHHHFAALPEGSQVSLSCGITVNKGPGGPSIVFPPSMLATLAALGAEVSIDVYCLPCSEA